MKVTVVVGNPKPRSRTAVAGDALARRIIASVPLDDADIQLIDLADHASRLFDWADEDVAALNRSVAASALTIVASPTYKATYTGMLKAFLDRYSTDGLAGVVAIPLMLGALPIHALAPEVHLRPLLVELGASVPTQGLFMVDAMVPDQLDAVIEPWLERNLATLAPAVLAAAGTTR